MKTKRPLSKLTAWVLTLLMLISISPTTYMSDIDDDSGASQEGVVINEDTSPEVSDPEETSEPTQQGDPEVETEPTDDSNDPTEPRDPTEPEEEPTDFDDEFLDEFEPDEEDDEEIEGVDDTDDEQFQEEPDEDDIESEELILTETEIILTDFEEFDILYLQIDPDSTEEIEIPFPETVDATLEVIETVTVIQIEEGTVETEEDGEIIEETEITETVIDEYEQVIDEYTESIVIDDWQCLGLLEYDDEGNEYITPAEFSFEPGGIFRFTSIVSWDDVADDIAPGLMMPTFDIMPFASSDNVIDVSDTNKLTGTNWYYTPSTQIYTITNGADVEIIGNNKITNGTADSSSRRRIEVEAGATVDIKLKGVSITGLGTDQSPLALGHGADATIEVSKDIGTSTLIAGTDSAAIQVATLSTYATLTITGDGHLIATGGVDGAGIGGAKSNIDGGIVTISMEYGGHIEASSNISGGGSAIGSGKEGACGTIIITSGKITAESLSGTGIGSEWLSSYTGGTIEISGGTINASSIGGSMYGPLRLVMNGNAVVYSETELEYVATGSSYTGGILGVGVNPTYVMFGTSVTPTDDFTLIAGSSFTFGGAGRTLTLRGVTMTNDSNIEVTSGGTLYIDSTGTLINRVAANSSSVAYGPATGHGTILLNGGTLAHYGTLRNNNPVIDISVTPEEDLEPLPQGTASFGIINRGLYIEGYDPPDQHGTYAPRRTPTTTVEIDDIEYKDGVFHPVYDDGGERISPTNVIDLALATTDKKFQNRGFGWTFSGGVYTILGTSDVVVINSNADPVPATSDNPVALPNGTGHRIVVANNANANITLDSMEIRGLAANISALTLGNGANATLTLKGTNNLHGGSTASGISGGASVTIKAASGVSDTLIVGNRTTPTAITNNTSGIDSGTVNIQSGTVIATGTTYGINGTAVNIGITSPTSALVTATATGTSGVGIRATGAVSITNSAVHAEGTTASITATSLGISDNAMIFVSPALAGTAASAGSKTSGIVVSKNNSNATATTWYGTKVTAPVGTTIPQNYTLTVLRGTPEIVNPPAATIPATAGRELEITHALENRGSIVLQDIEAGQAITSPDNRAVITIDTGGSVTGNKITGAGANAPVNNDAAPSPTINTITVKPDPALPALLADTGQQVQYAIAAVNSNGTTGTLGTWNTATAGEFTFTGLSRGTTYRIFARSTADAGDNFSNGTQSTGYAEITTLDFALEIRHSADTDPDPEPSYRWELDAEYPDASADEIFEIRPAGGLPVRVSGISLAQTTDFVIQKIAIGATTYYDRAVNGAAFTWTPTELAVSDVLEVTIRPLNKNSGTYNNSLVIAAASDSSVTDPLWIYDFSESMALVLYVKRAAAANATPPGVTEITETTITISPSSLSPSNGQEIEYAIGYKDSDPDNWTDMIWTGPSGPAGNGWVTMSGSAHTFTGLIPGTEYVIYARAKENSNYEPGEGNAVGKTAVLLTHLYSATLSVTSINGFTPSAGSDAANVPVSFTPNVTGIFNYGTYTFGFTGTATYTLTNTGNQPFDIKRVTSTNNTNFTITSGPVTGQLDPGDSVNISVYVSGLGGTASHTNPFNIVTDIEELSELTVSAPAGAPTALHKAEFTVNMTVTITAAAGHAVSLPSVLVADVTGNSISIYPVSPPLSGQAVEYAISTSSTANPDTLNWTVWPAGSPVPPDTRTFTGLGEYTNYYIYARSQANNNYNTGTAVVSSAIRTLDVTSPTAAVSVNSASLGLTNTEPFTSARFIKVNSLSDTVAVAVTAADPAPASPTAGQASGLTAIEYLAINAETSSKAFYNINNPADRTQLEALTGWTSAAASPLTSNLGIGTHYIYVRVTDNADRWDPDGTQLGAYTSESNITLLGSVGVVIYADSSRPITTAVSYTKSPAIPVVNTDTVTLNGNTVASIRLPVYNGSGGITWQTVTYNNTSNTTSSLFTRPSDNLPVPYFTVSSAGVITFEPEYLDTLPVSGSIENSNPYNLTVSFNPRAITYPGGTGNTAPATLTIPFIIIGNDPDVRNFAIYDGTVWDAVWYGPDYENPDYYDWVFVYGGDTDNTIAAVNNTISTVGATQSNVGLGTVTIRYRSTPTGEWISTPVNVGTYYVYADIAVGINYNAGVIYLGELVIEKADIYVSDITVIPRDYNGSADAAISDVTFSGLKNNEVLTPGTDYTVSAVYDSKNAGLRTVTATVNLITAGTSLGRNYELIANPSTPANPDADIFVKNNQVINRVMLTITGFKDFSRPYNGLPDIDISDGFGELSFSGFAAGETASVGTSSVIGASFADEHIGTGKDILFDGEFDFAPGSTADLMNYTFLQPELKANITIGFTPVNGIHYLTTENSNGWITEEFKVDAMPGYWVGSSNTDAGPWYDSITIVDDTVGGSVSFYLRNKETLEISTVGFEEFMMDNTPPTATIRYTQKNVVREFLNIITFYVRFTSPVTGHISAYDDLSGVASLEYALVNADYDVDDDGNVTVHYDPDTIRWKSRTRFTTSLNTTYVVFVRVRDNAGNEAILYDGLLRTREWGIPPEPEVIREPRQPSEPEPDETEPEPTPGPTVPPHEGSPPIIPPDGGGPLPGDLGEVIGNATNIWWWFFFAFLFLILLLLFLFLLLWKRRKEDEEEEEEEGDSGGLVGQPAPAQEKHVTG